MKLRNKILAMAVVAVAGVNVYLANDIQVQKNSLSLLNLENIADASETFDIITECDVIIVNSDKTVTRMYCDDTRKSCETSNPGSYSPFGGPLDIVSCAGNLCTITVG